MTLDIHIFKIDRVSRYSHGKNFKVSEEKD